MSLQHLQPILGNPLFMENTIDDWTKFPFDQSFLMHCFSYCIRKEVLTKPTFWAIQERVFGKQIRGLCVLVANDSPGKNTQNSDEINEAVAGPKNDLQHLRLFGRFVAPWRAGIVTSAARRLGWAMLGFSLGHAALDLHQKSKGCFLK